MTRSMPPRMTLGCALASSLFIAGCAGPGSQQTAMPQSSPATLSASAQASSGSPEPSTQKPSSSAPVTASPTPSKVRLEQPVDFVRGYLAGLENGDAEKVCGEMTFSHRAQLVADAIENGVIRKGGNCKGMVEQFAKDNQFEPVTSSDAKLKELSNSGGKAAVKVSYDDPMYAPYTLFLIEVAGRWVVSGEKS